MSQNFLLLYLYHLLVQITPVFHKLIFTYTGKTFFLIFGIFLNFYYHTWPASFHFYSKISLQRFASVDFNQIAKPPHKENEWYQLWFSNSAMTFQSHFPNYKWKIYCQRLFALIKLHKFKRQNTIIFLHFFNCIVTIFTFFVSQVKKDFKMTWKIWGICTHYIEKQILRARLKRDTLLVLNWLISHLKMGFRTLTCLDILSSI